MQKLYNLCSYIQIIFIVPFLYICILLIWTTKFWDAVFLCNRDFCLFLFKFLIYMFFVFFFVYVIQHVKNYDCFSSIMDYTQCNQYKITFFVPFILFALNFSLLCFLGVGEGQPFAWYIIPQPFTFLLFCVILFRYVFMTVLCFSLSLKVFE